MSFSNKLVLHLAAKKSTSSCRRVRMGGTGNGEKMQMPMVSYEDYAPSQKHAVYILYLLQYTIIQRQPLCINDFFISTSIQPN